ncbi:MAG: HAD family phosphatase [Clostridia bacterium]|nr:HAD family phosphatase [Clostridia bacterium]
MIKNVVFDFGQVMVHFVPAHMVAQSVTDKEDAALLEEVVFDRLYWDRLDAGTISDEEALSAMCARLPERLHGVARELHYDWIWRIPEIDGMRKLVQDIKRDFGVRTFLLSNISTYFAENEAKIPCLVEFEKRIYSAVCGYVKPSAEMYGYLCRECEIDPKETIFIDDSEKNIRGAVAFGIHGYLFDGDASRLRTYLYEILKDGRS